jgi:poly-gamma-glutamate synthesis protein (capsule biosynthesis protein)
MQHLPQVQGARNEDGSFSYDSCFHWVKERISAADLAGINFETTLGEVPYAGYPLFSSPDAFAFSLKDTGFDIFFQANNHALDRGRKGLERTIDLLDSVGIKHTGTFGSEGARSLHYPLMVIKNGIRIAFLNYTYDTNGLIVQEPNQINVTDTNLIKQDIGRTQLYKPDIIIAQMHWGEEYRLSASPGCSHCHRTSPARGTAHCDGKGGGGNSQCCLLFPGELYLKSAAFGYRRRHAGGDCDWQKRCRLAGCH